MSSLTTVYFAGILIASLSGIGSAFLGDRIFPLKGGSVISLEEEPKVEEKPLLPKEEEKPLPLEDEEEEKPLMLEDKTGGKKRRRRG